MVYFQIDISPVKWSQMFFDGAISAIVKIASCEISIIADNLPPEKVFHRTVSADVNVNDYEFFSVSMTGWNII